MVLNKLKIISPIAGCLVRIAHVQTCFYASQNRNSWPRLMLPGFVRNRRDVLHRSKNDGSLRA